ncbi:MAG: tRNA pseudouridine(13) synthase TruD [Arenicella sp.]
MTATLLSVKRPYFSEHFFDNLYYANGSLQRPECSAFLKSEPRDFVVKECFSFNCSGQGEHVWLKVKKVQQHTEQVAKLLARFANVAVRDVGYSGMKDVQGVTTQWFSVWLPGVKPEDWPDWQELNSEQITVQKVISHDKKLQRGTHVANQFEIVLKQFSGDIRTFSQSIDLIRQRGVPNYFGVQRFGHRGSNLNQAMAAFEQGKRIKQRHKRSLLLSAARAWLFNTALSKRLRDGSWLRVYDCEPLNLQGTQQYFIAEDKNCEQLRVDVADVHTTGPMWGKPCSRRGQQLADDSELAIYEQDCIERNEVFAQGLVKAGLEYARRPLRFLPKDLIWEQQGEHIVLTFSLARGQYATSLLRELVDTNQAIASMS